MGIKRIHYSTENGNFVTEKINDIISDHVCSLRKVMPFN